VFEDLGTVAPSLVNPVVPGQVSTPQQHGRRITDKRGYRIHGGAPPQMHELVPALRVGDRYNAPEVQVRGRRS
jgi:hypothetical protein